ncbi:MAG TPA: hypothetical protein V6C72_07690, partial [Chroococcales cyanobacterium]
MKRIYVYRAIGLILFAAVLAFAGWAGVNKWHSDQEKASPGFVTQLTASNAQAKLTANGSKLMFVELCDSYTCNQMKDSLKSTANKYHDKINFYVVNVESDANVAAVFEQAAGQALQQAGSGMPQAFPMYIIMDAQGNVGNFNIG